MNRLPENYYSIMTHRSELVLGKEAMDRLACTRVIVFGLGGVGSWCAEALVRTGIRHITLVDYDTICTTNINRQVQATSANTGKPKADALKQRLLEINPGLDITAIGMSYDVQSYDKFDLSEYGYVIDAIDSIQSKLHLIEECITKKITVFSSMGAGAKTDPSRIRTELLSNTHTCPLARLVRTGLRKKNVSTDIMCVFSDESPIAPACADIADAGPASPDTAIEEPVPCGGSESPRSPLRKKRVNGSLVHITGIFGFMLAGLVIRDIIKK